MTYLKFEINDLKKLFKQTRMLIINYAKKYSIKIKRLLLIYHENDELKSSYFINNQVESILQHLHDEHGHFSHLITLNRLKNEKY